MALPFSCRTTHQEMAAQQAFHVGSCSSWGNAFPPPKAGGVNFRLAAPRRPFSIRAVATSNAAVGASEVAVRDVPGSYGLPLLGALRDRLNYFVIQGRDEFFYSLMKRYDSTVVRVNMPPGPPLFPDGRTIMMLDQKSIRVVFDSSKVEKRDVFAGTYMPSTDFTGGFRVLSYLDPSEEKHGILKSFCFEMLKSGGKKWLPEFHTAFTEAASNLESQLAETGSAAFQTPCQQFAFNFLVRSVLGVDPSATSLGDKGPSLIQAWTAVQLAPQTSLGLPKLLEALLHTFPVPYALVAKQYKQLYSFFRTHGDQNILAMAQEKFGLNKEEACTNVLFFICFNTWGGLQILLPSVVKRIAEAGLSLQRELAAEVRSAVGKDGVISMTALESMELVHSTVYEVLRIDPPVPFQYGRAKADMLVESHNAAYKIKKGELLAAYQKIAMRDTKVFASPDSFQPKRFMGAEGKKLLNSLTWSNGPETEDPTLSNKQCAGKNFVILVTRLFVAEFFMRYESLEVGPIVEKGPNTVINFTSLQKRKG